MIIETANSPYKHSPVPDIVDGCYLAPSQEGMEPNSQQSLSPHLAIICQTCSKQREINELHSEVGYWKSMHQRAVARETTLKEEVAELSAKLKQLNRQLFARKSEHCNNGTQRIQETSEAERKRGHQPGQPGNGRKLHDHLPAVEEIHDLPEEKKYCDQCGLPFIPFPGTEDSEVIEIDVRAHRRIIKRKRYTPGCCCDRHPAIITADAPAKLIPKGMLGNSVWVTILIDKFLSYRPTNRLLDNLKLYGLKIAQGTVTDGLKRLAPLFEPIQKEIIAKNLTEIHWHADETRWLVFERLENKIGRLWYLWVFRTETTVVYVLAPSRSAKVPLAHFQGVQKGILSVDRYSAYKALIKQIYLALAFCWAHVRRDFLNLAHNWPILENWAIGWVEQIGQLYHLNNQRLEVLDNPTEFATLNARLKMAVEQMAAARDHQLNQNNLHTASQKVLESLKRHWNGLTIFVDNPEIPMDNNSAEQSLRGPAVGRKNFYGSGAIWSGRLAAVMFSIFQTLLLWNINPKLWLTAYLDACAKNHGSAPQDLSTFLPWEMSGPQRKAFTLDKDKYDST